MQWSSAWGCCFMTNNQPLEVLSKAVSLGSGNAHSVIYPSCSLQAYRTRPGPLFVTSTGCTFDVIQDWQSTRPLVLEDKVLRHLCGVVSRGHHHLVFPRSPSLVLERALDQKLSSGLMLMTVPFADTQHYRHPRSFTLSFLRIDNKHVLLVLHCRIYDCCLRGALTSSRAFVVEIELRGSLRMFFTRKLSARYGVTPRPPYLLPLRVSVLSLSRQRSCKLTEGISLSWLCWRILCRTSFPVRLTASRHTDADPTILRVRLWQGGSASNVLLPRLFFPRVRLHGRPEVRECPWLLLWSRGERRL